MWRHSAKPREGWQQTVESQGLVFPLTPKPDGTTVPYWNESAWYEFTQAEVDSWEAATEALWGMCLDAVAKMVTDLSDDFLRLPRGTLDLARESIRRRDPSVYGRFDLAVSGADDVKMLELNGDTPTGLVETGVAQWWWKESELPENDQWNSVHDRLVDRWAALKAAKAVPGDVVHFFYADGDDSGEEEMTLTYMADCAVQAGLKVKVQPIQDTKWNDHPTIMGFLDDQYTPIRSAFKLYPWEALLSEDPGGAAILARRESTPVRWIEPVWKVLMSTKAILPVLWEMNPDHPLLLPAYFDGPRDLDRWVAKPFQGREGDNIRVHLGDGTPDIVNDGDYGDDPLVYQQFVDLPSFDGNRAVLGSWIINGESAGAIVRESYELVTDYYSRVCPHAIFDSLEPPSTQTNMWRAQRVTDEFPTLREVSA